MGHFNRLQDWQLLRSSVSIPLQTHPEGPDAVCCLLQFLFQGLSALHIPNVSFSKLRLQVHGVSQRHPQNVLAVFLLLIGFEQFLDEGGLL